MLLQLPHELRYLLPSSVASRLVQGLDVVCRFVGVSKLEGVSSLQ